MNAPDSPVAPDAPVSQGHPPVTGADRNASILDDVRAWFARFVCTMDPADLDLLALWAAHTHLCQETYTSPRLVLDSPVPGSGKTTVLEHLERLCLHPVQMAALSSSALLVRMLDAGMRTILIDEADRSLNADKEGVPELLAVLNSGYKRGGTRPVLVPTKDGWTVSEMPTFSPVAMAGNNPNLPEDTKSRTIRVLLMPDIDGTAEESDWELIDEEARGVGNSLVLWAESVRDEVRSERPPLPPVVIGRARERWLPLKRVAVAAGGRWPAVVDVLAVRDVERVEIEREEGIMTQRPAVVLLQHIKASWGSETFIPTETLIHRLIEMHPETWGSASAFGKALTAQRLGKMLVSSYNVHSARMERTGPRGYTIGSFEQAFRRMGIKRAGSPGSLQETGASGASGDIGAEPESDPLPETGATGDIGATGARRLALVEYSDADESPPGGDCETCGAPVGKPVRGVFCSEPCAAAVAS